MKSQRIQRKRMEKTNGKEGGQVSGRYSDTELHIYRHWTKVSVFRNLMYSRHTKAKIFSPFPFFLTSNFYYIL